MNALEYYSAFVCGRKEVLFPIPPVEVMTSIANCRGSLPWLLLRP